jgi:hypothetical protein
MHPEPQFAVMAGTQAGHVRRNPNLPRAGVALYDTVWLKDKHLWSIFIKK